MFLSFLLNVFKFCCCSFVLLPKIVTLFSFRKLVTWELVLPISALIRRMNKFWTFSHNNTGLVWTKVHQKHCRSWLFLVRTLKREKTPASEYKIQCKQRRCKILVQYCWTVAPCCSCLCSNTDIHSQLLHCHAIKAISTWHIGVQSHTYTLRLHKMVPTQFSELCNSHLLRI